MNSSGIKSSVLVLDELVFDKIEFTRHDLKNDNELEFNLKAKAGRNNDGIYRVVLTLEAEKLEEYTIEITISGFFSFKESENLSDEMKETLINRNAVAIIMPYLRSQMSLLTAQPGMDCVVLPPFNVSDILNK